MTRGSVCPQVVALTDYWILNGVSNLKGFIMKSLAVHPLLVYR